MKKYDAIVVGSGIGGMAAGVLMAHQGKKVLMVEKHDCLGGRVSAYKKGEFNFDLGVHIISRGNKGPLGEVLRRVGAENNLEYTNVRPLSSYDGKTFIFPHDLATMVPEEDFLGVNAIKSLRPKAGGSACLKRSPQGGLFLVKQGEIWYNKYG